MSLLTACSDASKKMEADEGVTGTLPDEVPTVTVLTLQPQPFDHELVSNGKVVAARQADLHFKSAGVVAQVYVKNGDYVKQGAPLAQLDKFRLSNQAAQAKENLEKAKLEMQDVLIGQGYPADDTTAVPQETMRLAKVRSGYDLYLSQYELAKNEEEQATLKAPYDGVVANLFAKPYASVTETDVCCTVIDTQGMEVEFTVLENELPLIKTGDKVVVIPFSDGTARYDGHVMQINPLVDEKGLVKVTAGVNAGTARLFSGMNVRVDVHRSLGDQLVIPKSAVVLRSGKQVVFTLKEGKAQWNYVQTGLENADSYSVTDGLQAGDVVIVDGNVNLAHDAPVIVR